jgi:hypothetical protein
MMAEPSDAQSRFNRRGLLAGGLTVSAAAVLAACKKKPEPEPGRVGFAPTTSDLPQVVVDDGVRLRTTTSIEYMIIDVYGTITKSGVLDVADQQLVDRLVADHKVAAARTVELTKSVGAEPYECANAWYMDRVVPPIFQHINGDKSQDIPPSDDPARDMMATVNAFESMAGAMYQNFVETLTTPDLRAEVMQLGATSARHAAVSAIHASGAPAAYVNPVILGKPPAEAKQGLDPLYAIPTEFGQLSATQLIIGAPSSAGTRFTLPIDTPAENSFAYNEETCPTT